MSEHFSYVIGMDCGTTNIKAVVLREDGKKVAEASHPSRYLNPGHQMQEQDAEDWWHSAKLIFQSLISQLPAGAAQEVRCIAVSSHTVTMLPMDAAGKPLRPAVTYQDSRSARELEELLGIVGRDRFVHIVGGQPSVAFLPPKLLWYRRNEPRLFEKTAFFLQASSYINFRLTGVPVTDIDQAIRTQCMDISTERWSPEIAAAIGVDLEALMPPVRQMDEIIGTVTSAAAAETGLAAGTPVLAGFSDAMAALMATGMSRLGEAGESSGTTSLVFAGGVQQSAPDAPVVTRPCAVPGIPWIFDAPIQASGASIKWFIDTMATQEKLEAEAHGISIYDYLNKLALEAVPGSHGLFYFPYLLGERAPLWNNYSRGMLIGMRMDTLRSEFARSIFEGTAYALRHVVETVKAEGAQVELLRVCGGGAKSRTWNMIKAAMLRVPVYVLSPESGDVPVGDALIAGHVAGIFPDLPEASARIIHVDEVIEPDLSWADAYDQLYPYYIDMYRSLDGDLRSLQGTLRKLYPIKVSTK